MSVFEPPNESTDACESSLVKYQLETVSDCALGQDVHVESMLVGGHVENATTNNIVFAPKESPPPSGRVWVSGSEIVPHPDNCWHTYR